jgi:hypothetical protein
MPKDRFRLAEIAQKHWCRNGEQMVWTVERKGHIGSADKAPHAVVGEVPAVELAETAWPLPTTAVSSGQFCTDERAHDPTVWGWAHAQHATHTASDNRSVAEFGCEVHRARLLVSATSTRTADRRPL